MSDTSAEPRDGTSIVARTLLERASRADMRTRRTLAAAIDDLFLPPEARLDDRTRAALARLLDGLSGAVEGEIREHAARQLRHAGDPALADAILGDARPVIDRLATAGLLRDPDFLGECLARVQSELTAAALAPQAPDMPEAPSLLVRLARSPDRVVAAAAAAALAAESARRSIAEGRASAGTGLPAELHHRLVWWVTAVVRERHAIVPGEHHMMLDRALAEAAMRSLAAHDEGDRVEAVVMRLAAAIGAQADELPPLLIEALHDRRLTLFVALIAHALGVAYELARELVLDLEGERLWLVLRALELPRSAIAEIGYLLAEADPRRDVEAFADLLDPVATIDPVTARLAIAPLTLHPDYRAALLALDAAEARR